MSLPNAVFGQQEQVRQMKEMNNSEDLFDSFIRTVLSSLPLMYVLINITLLIWMAQIIFSSNLVLVPRSIYLISPLFSEYPLCDLLVIDAQSGEQKCPTGYEMMLLKTFPTISDQHMAHRYLFAWGEDQIVFCGKRLSSYPDIGVQCHETQIACNGYCANSYDQCPITKIEKIYISDQPVEPDGVYFFNSSSNWSYRSSKQQGKPIARLLATFQAKCSNDYRYYDEYQTIDPYWKDVSDCGEEGTVKYFYDSIDVMATSMFLYNNKIPISIDPMAHYATIELGTVFEIGFKSQKDTNCVTIRARSNYGEQELLEKAIEPQFTQGLLVVAFVLLISQMLWLVSFYCIQGYLQQKNTLVLLMAIVELTVTSFIYNENTSLFRAQAMINSIVECIDSNVVAAQHWSFGIQSPTAFIMAQFVAVAFLSLFTVSFLLDQLMFGDYRTRKLIVTKYEPHWQMAS